MNLNIGYFADGPWSHKAFDKLSKIIKAFDGKCELIVKTNKKQFKK